MNIKRIVTILFIVIVIVALAVIAGGCSRINKWFGLADDNIAEECFEGYIEKNTGVDIDLTPDSLERV